jgi:lipopolysaccharide export LptBFGC system permease protein LptF
VGVRVLLCGGLLVMLMVGGELHMPLLLRERLPVFVGAWLLLLMFLL